MPALHWKEVDLQEADHQYKEITGSSLEYSEHTISDKTALLNLMREDEVRQYHMRVMFVCLSFVRTSADQEDRSLQTIRGVH